MPDDSIAFIYERQGVPWRRSRLRWFWRGAQHEENSRVWPEPARLTMSNPDAEGPSPQDCGGGLAATAHGGPNVGYGIKGNPIRMLKLRLLPGSHDCCECSPKGRVPMHHGLRDKECPTLRRPWSPLGEASSFARKARIRRRRLGFAGAVASDSGPPPTADNSLQISLASGRSALEPFSSSDPQLARQPKKQRQSTEQNDDVRLVAYHRTHPDVAPRPAMILASQKPNAIRFMVFHCYRFR